MAAIGSSLAYVLAAVVSGLTLTALVSGWFDGSTHPGLLMAATSPGLTGLVRRRRGRPRKFDEPSRVVSFTLPESLIASLADVHPDLGMAVARLAMREQARAPRPAVELEVFGKRAVLSVRPVPALEARLGVELVPLPDGRALLALDGPLSVADLELRVTDALDDTTLPPADRECFEGLRAILRDARRNDDVALLRRNIIVLQSDTRSHD